MQKSLEKNPLISEDARITLAPRRKRNRIWEIDFLRGVCVILMILDHLAILLGVVFRQSMVRLRLRAQRRRRCVYDVLLQLDKRQRKRCSRYNTPHSFVRIFLDIGHILHFFAQQCKARISTARRCIDLHVGLVYRTKPNGNKRRIRCVRRA